MLSEKDGLSRRDLVQYYVSAINSIGTRTKNNNSMIQESWRNFTSDAEVIDMSKEIALFMNKTIIDREDQSYVETEPGIFQPIAEWSKYHESMDWLCQVIEKVEDVFHVEVYVATEQNFSTCVIFDKKEIFTKSSLQSHTFPVFSNIANFLKEQKYIGFMAFIYNR